MEANILSRDFARLRKLISPKHHKNPETVYLPCALLSRSQRRSVQCALEPLLCPRS